MIPEESISKPISKYCQSCFLKFFVVFFLSVLTFSCSSPDPVLPDAANAQSPTPTPKPTPPKKPEKKPEFAWACKFSNGEGRIFTGIRASQDLAEIKGKQECMIYSRNCTLLVCESVEK